MTGEREIAGTTQRLVIETADVVRNATVTIRFEDVSDGDIVWLAKMLGWPFASVVRFAKGEDEVT